MKITRKKFEIRALIDNRSETMGKKIREAELNKIPYMLIVGENEQNVQEVSVRKHGGEDLGSMTVEDFAALVNDNINASLKEFKI